MNKVHQLRPALTAAFPMDIRYISVLVKLMDKEGNSLADEVQCLPLSWDYGSSHDRGKHCAPLQSVYHTNFKNPAYLHAKNWYTATFTIIKVKVLLV
jgi:hypothetical protein